MILGNCGVMSGLFHSELDFLTVVPVEYLFEPQHDSRMKFLNVEPHS